MKKALLAAVVLAMCAMTGTALAGTYGFDDLPAFTVPPPGYAQINTWNGSFETINRDCCDGDQSGYWTNNVSPENELFDPFGNPAQLGAPGDPTFTLTSFYTGAAWNDGEDLEIQGRLNGAMLFDTHVTISSIGPAQLVTLGWAGIDEVDFIPTGGANHGWNGSGEHFIIDDLTINGGGGVPEPGTLVMLGSGVVGVAGLLRRKLSL
jgi:hypothetical protein